MKAGCMWDQPYWPYRYLGESLAATIVKSDVNDALNFGMIVGVGDSSTFDSNAPTWEQPPSTEELCYVGVFLTFWC
jgi:hypothetical protein